MTMDVIYYNEGRHECFEYSLSSVKKRNTEAKIHILEAADYADEYKWFEDNYVHMSTNPPYFEKACLRRWPIISGYVNKNRINRFIVMDWDVLCFCNYDEELQPYFGYDFTYQNRISIGFSLWNNRDALDRLVEIIRTVYCDRDSALSKKLLRHDGGPGGVCDMVMARELIEMPDYKSIDLYAIINSACFDNNMTITEGWKSIDVPGGKVKAVDFKDSVAYCEYKGKTVKMNVLHFAGHARPLIKEYWRRCNAAI